MIILLYTTAFSDAMLARFGARGVLVFGSLAVCDNITTAFSDAMLARFGAHGILVLGSLAVCDNVIICNSIF